MKFAGEGILRKAISKAGRPYLRLEYLGGAVLVSAGADLPLDVLVRVEGRILPGEKGIFLRVEKAEALP